MRKLQAKSAWFGAWAAVFAAGCGGGQSGGAAPAGTAKTSQAGDAVITYFGQPKPQVAISSGAVGVVAQAGATFSTVTLEPPPNLDDTYLVFSRDVGGFPELYKLALTGGGAQLLYRTPYVTVAPAASAYGTVAFNTSNNNAINTIRLDGTGPTQLNFGGTNAFYPAYAIDGTNRLAFTNGSTGIYIGPGTGGSPTLVQNISNLLANTNLAWSPSGKELAFSAGSDGLANLYETSTSGGTPNNVTPSSLQASGLLFQPSWNQDGLTIATTESNGGSTSQIITFAAVPGGAGAYATITPSGDSDEFPCWSPDGTKLAFYRKNANSSTAGIYMCDANGLFQQIFLADPSADVNSIYGLTWTPFLPKETVIAASGATFYHQAASGYLLSQYEDQFGSVVAFTANTPSSAAIQAPTNSQEPAPMLFTISADSISSIGYINDYFSPGTTISLTSTPSVVVSIDPNTGVVDLVAPAAVTKPAFSKNADGTVTYNSKFKAIYDGTGKNLAPSGASRLVVSPKTGKLVSFS